MATPTSPAWFFTPMPSKVFSWEHCVCLRAIYTSLFSNCLFISFVCFSTGLVFSMICSGSLKVKEKEPSVTEHSLFHSVQSGVYLYHSTETASSSHQWPPDGAKSKGTPLSSSQLCARSSQHILGLDPPTDAVSLLGFSEITSSLFSCWPPLGLL